MLMEKSRKVKKVQKAKENSIFLSTVIYIWDVKTSKLRPHYADLIEWNKIYDTFTLILCKGDRLYLTNSHPLTYLPKWILSKLGKKQALSLAYYWKEKPAFVEIKPNSWSIHHGKSRIGLDCFFASGIFEHKNSSINRFRIILQLCRVVDFCYCFGGVFLKIPSQRGSISK